MKRNRQQTEKRIVEAAISLLADVGFQGFGVNAVAARAKVDKVLIYRYFDGLNGLLEFIGNTEVLFPSAAAMLDTDLTGFFRNYCQALSANKLGATLHDWQRVADNPLTQAYRRQCKIFWEDASRLLRPQSSAGRALISLLAAAPLDANAQASITPLLAETPLDPLHTATHETEDDTDRLADNLL